MKKETREKMIQKILEKVRSQKDNIIWEYVVMFDDNAQRSSYTIFVTDSGFGYVDGFHHITNLPDLKRFQDAKDEEIQKVFRDLFGRRKLEEILNE